MGKVTNASIHMILTSREKAKKEAYMLIPEMMNYSKVVRNLLFQTNVARRAVKNTQNHSPYNFDKPCGGAKNCL